MHVAVVMLSRATVPCGLACSPGRLPASRCPLPSVVLQAEAHEQALQQQLAVCQLELRKLTAALQARRRRMDEAQRKLQALLP